MSAPVPARRRRHRAGGALIAVALLFGASGALRLGDGVGTAMARSADPVAPVAPAPAHCPLPPEALAAALSAREARVATREAAIAERLAALALAEETVTSRLGVLEEAESRLTATLARADGAAAADLDRLTAVYSAMKPQQAATLFAAMAPDFAAGFLGRMAPEAAAAVLGGMEPQAAYAISAILAGRNALAPTE